MRLILSRRCLGCGTDSFFTANVSMSLLILWLAISAHSEKRVLLVNFGAEGVSQLKSNRNFEIFGKRLRLPCTTSVEFASSRFSCPRLMNFFSKGRPKRAKVCCKFPSLLTLGYSL